MPGLEANWGHARDFVEGMWRIVQQPKPDDYVLATGEMHSFREFVELAFNQVGRNIYWSGKGVDEVGICGKTGRAELTNHARLKKPAISQLQFDLLAQLAHGANAKAVGNDQHPAHELRVDHRGGRDAGIGWELGSLFSNVRSGAAGAVEASVSRDPVHCE